MTFDEIKNALLTSGDEGVDRAAVYDSVLEEIASSMSSLEEANRKVEDLTNRVTELTENNLKLLEKVKYMTEDEVKEDEPDPEIVTIDNLFEEE